MTAISIIIPVYNVEKYLRECLNSILAQSFQDFEVICVDDGSTDNSMAILEEYRNRDSRFLILKQKHQGAGAARNLGLESAKGKYVQFLDADDYFEPDMLEELYNHAIKYDSDLVVCSSKTVDEEGNIIERGNPISPINLSMTPLEKPFSWRDFPNIIFSMFTVVPWNKLYLKEMLVNNNIRFQNLTSCNDVAFGHLVRVVAKKILVFNKELVNRRKRKGSISSDRGSKTINVVRALMYIGDWLVENGYYESLQKSYKNAFKAHVRWEITHCNQEQYEKFVADARSLMGDKFSIIISGLKKDHITAEYLSNYIGGKKVILWGASLFLRKILEEESEKNPNIIGIVDRNTALWGKRCGNYEIFSPDVINELKPEAVLLTVLSMNEVIYDSMQETFAVDFPGVELLPNIFEKDEYATDLF